MKIKTTYLYALIWIIFLIFALVMFPVWRINVFIPAIGLIGIGAWMYGSSIGLLLVLFIMVYQYLICGVLYADLLIYYESRAAGCFIVIFTALFSAALRKNIDSIKEMNARLDKTVARRNKELNSLAEKLIERREKMRVELGEELHNGIGQEMTGIQLYSSSLAETMVEERNPSASLAFSLRARARTTHELIRWTARTLFPVKIGETGIIPALHEFSSCLEESKTVKCSITNDNWPQDIPDDTSLQLYRICQETVLYILKKSGANRINIKLAGLLNDYKLEVAYNSETVKFDNRNDVDAQLIEYRLSKISGTMTSDESHSFTFSLPKAQ